MRVQNCRQTESRRKRSQLRREILLMIQTKSLALKILRRAQVEKRKRKKPLREILKKMKKHQKILITITSQTVIKNKMTK
jgi:hypothetical protein